MSTTTASQGAACVNNWPKEVQGLYEPVRVLGTGGFASVMLAKKNETNKDATLPSFVAMKMVGPTANTMSSESWRLYAHRELDILRELSHPNVIKVIHKWETDEKNPNSPILMALQYSKGPTVQDLLLHRGALNPREFGRVVIAQLVDALSYLHSRAVIHRDIKPDNVIVTGALSSQDCIWQVDGERANHSESNGGDNTEETSSTATPVAEPDWDSLRKKWHVTLIDFGFARALTPDDVTKPSDSIQKENANASYSMRQLNINPAEDEQQEGSNSKKQMSKAPSGRNKAMHRSFSRRIHKQMSALGNRQYAAPEILKVQRNSSISSNNYSTRTSTTSVSSSTTTPAKRLTETISEFVSDYGLLVDAFSLGHTIRYMLTGVPPNESAAEKISYKKSLMYKIGQQFKKKSSPPKPKKIYRLESDLPGEVQQLIGNLTERLESKRTSVRTARRYSWIDNVLLTVGTTTRTTINEEQDDIDCEDDIIDFNKQISFLSMALVQQEA